MQAFPELSDTEIESILFFLGTMDGYKFDSLDSLLNPNYSLITQLQEEDDKTKLVKND